MIKISQNSEVAEQIAIEKLLVVTTDFTLEPDKGARERFFSQEGKNKVDRVDVDAVRDRMFFVGGIINPSQFPKPVIEQMLKSGCVKPLGELPPDSRLRGKFAVRDGGQPALV
jgi:hypothetical protein